MKNTGFTLAEVLVTLGIIGVIAMLTIPSLNTNVQSQKVGPAFAKAVNTLTNANRLALVENDARYLSSISTNYYDVLSKYVSGHSDGGSGYTSSDGISYTSSNFSSFPVNITVDINGSKNPNTMGKDQFKVLIYKDGGVVPYGGLEYQKYQESSGSALWESGCSGNTVTSPATCAGAIADNGWTVKYNYSLVGTQSSSDDSGSDNGDSGSGKGS